VERTRLVQVNAPEKGSVIPVRLMATNEGHKSTMVKGRKRTLAQWYKGTRAEEHKGTRA
jgi:hypothetical protein